MTDDIVENYKSTSSYTSTSLDKAVKIRIRDDDAEPIAVPQFFAATVKKHGDRPALVSQDNEGNWLTLTYNDYWTKSRQIARAFIKLGLQPRTSCGILAYSSPEWFISQMAAIFDGGVSVGIYMTNSADAVYHVLDTSNATICIVDDSVQMAKVRSIKHRLTKLRSIIQIHGPYEDFVDREEGYWSWPQVELLGASNVDLELQVEQRLKGIVANECVTLIFTSGTVGKPKGVMLSHDNIITISNAIANGLANIIYGHEVIVSYLPMNHVGGQVMDFFLGLSMGACIYFADRDALKGTLIKTLVKAQPTRFFTVPRMFEKMQEKIIAAERELSWISRFILSTAKKSVEYHHLSRMENEHKPINNRCHWLASKILERVKVSLGFGRCKTFLIGAAPSSPEIKKFFLGYDIKLTELYGLSESSGPSNACWNLEDLYSCGRPLRGIEIKVIDTDEKGHGQICIRGRIVFMGYLNEPEKTKETLSADGWLKTGDFGYLNRQGCLFITGRLKELIITSGGENISPTHIEMLILHELPGLSNAMLIGDRRKFLTMLVSIKTEIDPNSGRPTDTLLPEALEWIKSLRLSYVTLTEILNAGPCPKVLQSIQKGIDRANANAISNAQRVQKFAILPQDFSIPTGELGPTLKLRRNIVLNKYADIIENFYK